MNEFELIDYFFKSNTALRQDVIIGIGDDAACVEVPSGHQLLISCDTLVADVHFLSTWDPYFIAYKAVMVNISDIAAMAGTPAWMSLALTLPAFDKVWLERFSQGLHDALGQFNVSLIGGDTTRGPLSMTLTIHGLVAKGQAVMRSGARVGDSIFVTGELGAAALAVTALANASLDVADKQLLEDKLMRPQPRVDWAPCLREFATAAIDISDGLSADLNHICVASKLGACLNLEKIPCHPILERLGVNPLDYALSGGDDYELCFTVPFEKKTELIRYLEAKQWPVYEIGTIEARHGLRAKHASGEVTSLPARGYCHFGARGC